jgi:hypothetical protein
MMEISNSNFLHYNLTHAEAWPCYNAARRLTRYFPNNDMATTDYQTHVYAVQNHSRNAEEFCNGGYFKCQHQ